MAPLIVKNVPGADERQARERIAQIGGIEVRSEPRPTAARHLVLAARR